jgi:hypothetical protein
MSKTNMLRVLVIALVSCCGHVAAESDASLKSSSLLANVIDTSGRPVRDLTKRNFQLKVDGCPATHLEATYSVAARRIVVLLDMSGSMSGQTDHTKWQIASEAVEDVLADTPDSVSVAMVTFSNQVHDVFDFSQNRNSMAKWSKEGSGKHGDPRIHGTTAILDAILTATDLFGSPHAGDSIYLISDADDNSSRAHEKQVRESLLRSGIRLFVFLFPEKTVSDDGGSGAEPIKELARATGGSVFGVRGRPSTMGPSWSFTYDYGKETREKIKAFTEELNIQVNGFYTLRFDLPVTSGQGKKILLRIVDDSGNPRKDVAFTFSTLVPQLK